MSKDKVIDSMGRIDDDIIQEVEVLRRRKRRAKGKALWTRLGAVAACICLIVGSMAIWRMLTVPTEENASELLASEEGVTIPPMGVSLSSNAEADMIGFFIYEGRCYVQYERIYEDTDIVEEYLGTATGLIDEWTLKEGYVDFAGSVRGDFYSVKGYDPSFMLCMKDARGVVSTYICNNGITIKYGKELYEDRLHLSENMEGVQYESRPSWYEGLGELYELSADVKSEESSASGEWNGILQEFINQLNLAEFMPCTAVPLEEGQSHMVDMEIYHLYFTMKDGTTIHLRLYENGYVRFQGMIAICVQVPAEYYDPLIALLEKRAGTPIESKEESTGITYEACVSNPELGSYVPAYIPENMELEGAEIFYYLDQATGNETGTKEIYLYYTGQQNPDQSYTVTITWAEEYGKNGWAGPMVEQADLNLDTIGEYSKSADASEISASRYPKIDLGVWHDDISVVISSRGLEPEIVLGIMKSVR